MFFASASSGARLACDQPSFTCPGSSVSCECQGSIALSWRVTSATVSVMLFSTNFMDTDTEGDETSRDGFTAVLSNITREMVGSLIRANFSSKLSFIFMENVTMECDDDQPGSATVLLQRASK